MMGIIVIKENGQYKAMNGPLRLSSLLATQGHAVALDVKSHKPVTLIKDKCNKIVEVTVFVH